MTRKRYEPSLLIFSTACERPNEEIVELLLRFGASPTKTCIQGGTPLHEAVRNKKLEICKILVQAGAKLWAKNVYGIDSLFTAAQCDAVDVLNFLICKGKNFCKVRQEKTSITYFNLVALTKLPIL